MKRWIVLWKYEGMNFAFEADVYAMTGKDALLDFAAMNPDDVICGVKDVRTGRFVA